MILYVVVTKEFKGYHSIYSDKKLANDKAKLLGYGYSVKKFKATK